VPPPPLPPRSQPLGGVAKAGLILGGYAVALVLAVAAVTIRVALTGGPEADASSGMHAFGDVLLFVATFGLAALVPTAAALRLLHPDRFWPVFATVALAVGAIGMAALVVFFMGARRSGPGSPLALGSAFAVLPLLAAPLLAPAFGLAGLLAPVRAARRKLFAAATIQAAVAAAAVLHWASAFPSR
jgi:hypothetical protein